MGLIVKLLGSSIGLASEAIHDYRTRSPSQSGQAISSEPAVISSSREAPPEYVEVNENATTDELVRNGETQHVPKYGRIRSSAVEYRGDDSDSDSSSSDDDFEGAQADDEAAWELDDMAEQVAPRSYGPGTGTDAAAAGEGESEEAKVKKEERMIREILRMAGPPPQPARRIPCPVIIPQRRPRKKDRGFVRAYAPILEECGVAQDVFLKFLKDWLAASKVRGLLPKDAMWRGKQSFELTV